MGAGVAGCCGWKPAAVRDSLPGGSLAAPPLPSPAITRREVPAGLPKLLLKRKKAAR